MEFTVTELTEADEAAALTLAESSFMEFVAPTFLPEGVEHVRGNFAPGSLLRDNENGHFCFLAERDDRIIGMVQARPPGHITKLYVAKQYHRRGIARRLLEEAARRLGSA